MPDGVGSDLDEEYRWLYSIRAETKHWVLQILNLLQSIAKVGSSQSIETVSAVYKSISKVELQQIAEPIAITCLAICILIVVFSTLGYRKARKKNHSAFGSPSHDPLCYDLQNCLDLTYNWSIFDLAKTAYEPGHTETVIKLIERLHFDVNSSIPSNGLTLFLCACLSGKRELISYMIMKGADVTRTTTAGDTALYLATFGVLSSAQPDTGVLKDIIIAGCDVNGANLGGYTALHRAAGHGNLEVIKTLLKYGADLYKVSSTGIYPIDSAINAGNLEAAELLKINISNPHVWDMVDPHTPPHIKLGLQSPQRKYLMESSRRIFAPRIA